MKQQKFNVDYKALPIVIFAVVTLLVFALIYFNNEPRTSGYSIFLFGCLIAICIFDFFALVLMPYSILIQNGRLVLASPFWFKKINLSDVKAVTSIDSYSDLGKCKLGSYGMLGFWGKWHSAKFGDYTAFYGRPDQCFFVRLKNGKGYMLGCKEYEALMQAIKDAIAEQ